MQFFVKENNNMLTAIQAISKGVLFLFFTFLAAASYSYTVSAIQKGPLPGVLVESSALDYTGESHFWSLDDSGNPNIYKITDNGSYCKTISVTNAINRNWEELTHDAGRNYMFIGDFGNNNCDRTNLRIYKIQYPSLIEGNTTTAEVINFTYPDQHRFPSRWLNFDAESFFHFKGMIYIFTKADGSAIGYTKMYSVPDSPGNYVATLVDSFYTNDRSTSADINAEGTAMVLLSNTHIHIFKNFTGSDFLGGDHTQLNISGAWTQKEGISFSSENEIYMTDENTGSGNKLYYIDLRAWIPLSPVISTSIETVKDIVASVYPVPANQSVSIAFKNVTSENLNLSIYDLTGKTIFESTVENPLLPFKLDTSELLPGIYLFNFNNGARKIQTSRLIVNH